jgi:hypothetical protein
MLIPILLSLSAHAAERPPEVGVTIEPLVAVDINSTNTNADNIESWTWVRARARQHTDSGQWFLGVDGEHHVRHGLDTEALWAMRVAESGWAGPVGPTHLRVGALIERWGKLDFTPVIDVLNPRDYRAGPLATIEALRVPVPMATIQVGNNSTRLEATWVPFASGDRISMEGSDWSLVKPGMLNEFAQDAATWEGSSAVILADPLAQLADSLQDLTPSTMRALGGAAEGAERPEANGLHGNYGVRLAVEAPGVDAAVVGANLLSPVPETHLSPSIRNLVVNERLPEIAATGDLLAAAPLRATWPRTWMAGAEISTVVGGIGVRSEAGWWSNRVVQEPWLEASTSPAVSAGVGLDWAHGSTLFLGIEGRWQRLIRPPKDLFMTQKDVVEIGGTARVSIANDKILLQAASLIDLSYSEWMARPEVRWRVSDPLSLGLGVIMITGKTEAPSTLRETLTWTGGPLGLMADNDCAFLSLQWIQ